MSLKIIHFFFLSTISVSPMASAQTIQLMSYNIRYDNPNDGPDTWDERKEEVAELIQFYRPDFLGLQEALLHQLAFIEEQLSDYSYVGVGRDDGNEQGEFSPIFYDTTRIELLEQGTFWLSEAPGEVSTGWDAALPRICTYGLFRLRENGEEVIILNTHFDHLGEMAREMSARLIAEQVALLNPEGLPVVLMGDFNAVPDSTPVSVLLESMEDAWISSEQNAFGPTGTFNGFDPANQPENRIDYIFISGLQVLRTAHLDHRRANGRWVSDHLPVWSVVKLIE